MSEILPTQEVGSLAKPNWRVQPFRDGLITEEHIEDAEVWARRLDFDPDEPVQILSDAQAVLGEYGELNETAGAAIKLLAARFAIRLQEQAGLDILYDGEQDRAEMYQAAVEGTKGFKSRGRVRAFDNKSYEKSAIVSDPALAKPWHDDEFNRINGLTEKAIKVPITGAYTIAAWSFDEYYARTDGKGRGLSPEKAREAFVLDLARNVIRPNVKSLLEAGAKWIQIDEPAATTVPGEVPLFVQAFNESVQGLEGNFSTHICFSDYSLLFPHIEDLENCSQFSLEFANRDPRELGTDKSRRPAYEILREFKRHAPDTAIGLGVSSVHDNDVEGPELVRDRVLRAVDIMDSPRLVFPSPDCGLRTRTWDIALKKLVAVTEGTQLAREVL